jgi:hypothetical protein
MSRLTPAAAAAAAALALAGCTPALTTHASCHGQWPLITAALGPAPQGYSGAAEVTLRWQDPTEGPQEMRLGAISPDGEASATVSGSGPVDVTVAWPDGTTTRRAVTLGRCSG